MTFPFCRDYSVIITSSLRYYYVIITSSLRYYYVIISLSLRHYYVIITSFWFSQNKLCRDYNLFLSRRVGYRYLAAYNSNVGGVQERPFFRSDPFRIPSDRDSDNEATNDWQQNILRVNYIDDVETFVRKFFTYANFPTYISFFVATIFLSYLFRSSTRPRSPSGLLRCLQFSTHQCSSKAVSVWMAKPVAALLATFVPTWAVQ